MASDYRVNKKMEEKYRIEFSFPNQPEYTNLETIKNDIPNILHEMAKKIGCEDLFVESQVEIVPPSRFGATEGALIVSILALFYQIYSRNLEAKQKEKEDLKRHKFEEELLSILKKRHSITIKIKNVRKVTN
jgi:hypothetical protein